MKRGLGRWFVLAALLGGLALHVGRLAFGVAEAPPAHRQKRVAHLSTEGEIVHAIQRAALSAKSSLVAANGSLVERVRCWKSETDPEARRVIEAEIAGGLSADNARGLLNALAPDFLDTALALAGLDCWAERAPAAALEWVAANSGSSRTQRDVVVSAWLKNDPRGLGAFLDALPVGEMKNDVLASAVSGALGLDRPEDAADWLLRLPADRRSGELMEAIVESWGKKDLAAASAWIMARADPGVQDRLLATMLGGYATTNPSGAAKFAQSVFGAGEPLRRAAGLIVSAWARTDARGAAEWIASVPEEEIRRTAIEVLMPAWLASDEAAARRWVLALPATTATRDQAIERVVRWSAQNAPEVAAAMLEHGSAGDLPQSARIGIMRQWARWDFTKASAWAERLPAGPLRSQAFDAINSAANEPWGMPF